LDKRRNVDGGSGAKEGPAQHVSVCFPWAGEAAQHFLHGPLASEAAQHALQWRWGANGRRGSGISRKDYAHVFPLMGAKNL